MSLSGELNVFDVREPSAKWRVLHGPTKSITAAALDKEQTFYTGSFDGSVKAFSVNNGECSDVGGSGHSARIVGIAPNGQDKVFTAAWDDKIATITGNEFTSSSLPTKSQPTGLAATPSGVYVASATGLEIVPASGGSATHIDGALTAVAAHAGPNGDVIALGTGPRKVTLATVSGAKLNVVAEFDDNKGDVLSLAFSADGGLLAAGDVSLQVFRTSKLTLYFSPQAESSSSTSMPSRSSSRRAGRSTLAVSRASPSRPQASASPRAVPTRASTSGTRPRCCATWPSRTRTLVV